MTFQAVLKILLVGAMFATVVTLTLGLFNMTKEGKGAGERSNKMMRLRIFFQALAILIFSILLFFKGKLHGYNLVVSPICSPGSHSWCY